MRKILIAALAKNRVIGRTSGEMPWHVKEEFQHFRNTTLGNPIIMGRKTFESLQQPLKGRLNVILTRNQDYNPGFEGIKVLNSIDLALDLLEKEKMEKCFIIGGGYIFEEAINIADEMILSFMNFEAEGDVFFPEIDETIWEIEKTDHRSQFDIIYFKRKTGK